MMVAHFATNVEVASRPLRLSCEKLVSERWADLARRAKGFVPARLGRHLYSFCPPGRVTLFH